MKEINEAKLLDYIVLKRKKKIEKFKNEIIEQVIQKISNLNHQEIVYTSKEVCEIYKFSASTLERHIRRGLKFKNSGIKTKRMFTKTEVENYFTKI